MTGIWHEASKSSAWDETRRAPAQAIAGMAERPETAAAALGQALPSQPNTRRGQERVLTELLCVRVRVCGRSGLAECNRLGGTWMDFSGQRVNQELYGQVLHMDVDGGAGRQLACEARTRVRTSWDGQSHIAGFSGG